MRALLRRAAQPVLTSLRRGEPTVIWAPSGGLGFGNVLYLWLRAHTETTLGRPTVVLLPSTMQYWVDAFPALEQLSVRRVDVDRWSRRTWGWYSAFGADFSRRDIDDFVRARLLGSALSANPPSQGSVAINVRRGNYYSEPHFRGTYSFDIQAYLAVALEALVERCEVTEIRVVSDGIDWCRLKLDEQLRATTRKVAYSSAVDSPLQNFTDCATSRIIVGTNSTFSYWAGYISNVLHRSESVVVMPRFHARLGSNHDAYQLDPEWLAIDHIPGGWDS